MTESALRLFSLECIRTRFSDCHEVPPFNPDGFRRNSNLPINNNGIEQRTETDATPPILEIPVDLHSVQTLQFLGFQWANAKEIFASFNLPEHENANSRLGLAGYAKNYIDTAETVAEGFTGADGKPMDDFTRLVTLTQDIMGLDLDGDRL